METWCANERGPARGLAEAVTSSTDADVIAGYARDWTGRFQGEARLVVRPGDTDQVAAVLARCADAARADRAPGWQHRPRRRLGARGPGRWSCCRRRRLTELGAVDTGAQQVTLGAAVTLARWRAHARAAGPTRRSTSPAATRPPSAARSRPTPAGHGSCVSARCAARSPGLTAVLADGSVVGSLAGLPKETVGLHWPSLLAGSEGTLGVITAVRLRVVPWYRHTATAMVTTRSLADAVAVLAGLRVVGAAPRRGRARAARGDGARRRPPRRRAAGAVARRGGAYLVVECADHADPTDELIGALADRPDVVDAAVTTEGPARERLVAFRDRITESIGAPGRAAQARRRRARSPASTSCSSPCGRSIAAHGGRLVPFGHLAEGNVHVNVLAAGDGEAITAEVLGAAAELGGTISAEHGVGVAKTRWLHLVRTPAELRRWPPSSTPSTPPASSTPASSHPSTERRRSTRAMPAIPGVGTRSTVRDQVACGREAEVGGGEERAVGDAGGGGHRRAGVAAVDDHGDEDRLGPERPHDLDRLHQRRAPRDGVLGDHDPVARLQRAGQASGDAVVLGLLAHAEAAQLAGPAWRPRRRRRRRPGRRPSSARRSPSPRRG